jgi:hypothetical protein
MRRPPSSSQQLACRRGATGNRELSRDGQSGAGRASDAGFVPISISLPSYRTMSGFEARATTVASVRRPSRQASATSKPPRARSPLMRPSRQRRRGAREGGAGTPHRRSVRRSGWSASRTDRGFEAASRRGPRWRRSSHRSGTADASRRDCTSSTLARYECSSACDASPRRRRHGRARHTPAAGPARHSSAGSSRVASTRRRPVVRQDWRAGREVTPTSDDRRRPQGAGARRRSSSNQCSTR